jgi:hypothetical protein
MTQPVPDDQDPPCNLCGKPALPFGQYLLQRFKISDTGFLCLSCARQNLPWLVRRAEVMERRLAFSWSSEEEDGGSE